MLNPWIWLIGGLVICFAEMLLPGAFLLWVGLAAMATGLFLLALPNALGVEGLLLLFAALALLFSFAGRAVYGSMTKTTKPEFLGQRAQGLIGRSFLLETAIVNGEGRIKVQDSVWNVRGPDMALGERVKVISVENGVSVRVERA